ncbi:MAG: hypothetical protein DRI90_03005 [Deltaproteobacteria bacterium]|nr:MAG: hypothetical protein DRI90_03005 [Deltaproteobacteria bacterium]
MSCGSWRRHTTLRLAPGRRGEVWCWGESSWGQTGTGKTNNHEALPVRVAFGPP